MTGSRYLPGGNFIELAMSLVRAESFLDQLSALDTLRPGLSGVLAGCLRESPDLRWPSVRAFLASLDSLVRPWVAVGEAPSVSPSEPEPAAPRRSDAMAELEQIALGRLDVFVTPPSRDAATAVVRGAAAR